MAKTNWYHIPCHSFFTKPHLKRDWICWLLFSIICSLKLVNLIHRLDFHLDLSLLLFTLKLISCWIIHSEIDHRPFNILSIYFLMDRLNIHITLLEIWNINVGFDFFRTLSPATGVLPRCRRLLQQRSSGMVMWIVAMKFMVDPQEASINLILKQKTPWSNVLHPLEEMELSVSSRSTYQEAHKGHRKIPS